MVSYLQVPLVQFKPVISAPAYPSFGSLIDFKLMYSSYSKSPENESEDACIKRCHQPTIELRMVPVKVELLKEEKDVFANQWSISCQTRLVFSRLRPMPLESQA